MAYLSPVRDAWWIVKSVGEDELATVSGVAKMRWQARHNIEWVVYSLELCVESNIGENEG